MSDQTSHMHAHVPKWPFVDPSLLANTPFPIHPFENNHNNIHGSFHGCDPPNLKPLRIETLRPGA